MGFYAKNEKPNKNFMYTALELFKKDLLLKADGKPYSDYRSVRRRLKNLGIEKTGINDKGVAIYQITKEQLKQINNYG